MKKFAKHFLKVLLAAMVASMTVTGALALEFEPVESAAEQAVSVTEAAYYADENTVLGTSDSVVVSFDNEITSVDVGNTEAQLIYSEDKKSVTVTGRRLCRRCYCNRRNTNKDGQLLFRHKVQART